MEQIDIELKNALMRTDPMPAPELAALKSRIVQSFASRQRAVHRMMLVYLVVIGVAMLGMLALFMSTSDLKQCILFGIGILMALEGTVLMKLWYWIIHSRIATVREIKMLQLTIVETKGQTSATQSPAALAPEKDAPESGSAAPALPKPWRMVLAVVWPLAMASFVYLLWMQNHQWDPRHVTPYFEKTVTAGDVSGAKEWQESFDITEPQKHFFVQVQAQGPAKNIRLDLSADGHGTLFSGQVPDGYRFYCGTANLGRYTVKLKADEAVGGCTLRIGGTDEFPNSSPMRLFLLMISGAVTVVIPLVWLQYLWLRRIDPEFRN